MMSTWKIHWRTWVLAAMLGMAGCAASPEPFDYHDDRDEKPGPGLFSGDEGGVVVYGNTRDRTTAEEETAPDASRPD